MKRINRTILAAFHGYIVSVKTIGVFIKMNSRLLICDNRKHPWMWHNYSQSCSNLTHRLNCRMNIRKCSHKNISKTNGAWDPTKLGDHIQETTLSASKVQNKLQRLRRENHNQTERLRILLATNTVTCSASRLHYFIIPEAGTGLPASIPTISTPKCLVRTYTDGYTPS